MLKRLMTVWAVALLALWSTALILPFFNLRPFIALIPLQAEPAQYIFAGFNKGASALPTWAYVQDKDNFSCSASATTCTVTGITATTANSVLVASMFPGGGSASMKMSSVWICTSNPCTSNSGGGTWVEGLSSAPLTLPGSNGYLDMYYNLGNTGGSTDMTITRTAGTVVNSWAIEIGEFKCTANCGTIALDQIGTPGSSTSCSSCSGASFSGLTGSSDLLVDFPWVDNTPSAASSPYAFTSDTNWMYALGSVQTSAPTFTSSPAGAVEVPGIAFK